jgi:hypothetical protein
MNQLLARQLDALLAVSAPPRELACESSLRRAASTVCDASAQRITAARVVRTFGADDPSAVEALVARLVDEYDMHASMRVVGDSFAVRFSPSNVN